MEIPLPHSLHLALRSREVTSLDELAEYPMTFPDMPLPEDDDERRAVFVSTAIPVPVDVAPIDDLRAPEGSVLGTYIGARLIARCAMPREAIDQLLSLKLFDQPVPLALLAVEEDPGVQGRLFALVPAERIIEAQQDAESPDEPWKASVPSFEDALEDDGDELDDDEDDMENEAGEKIASILLGHIVRFSRDRMHSDDLAAEAVDILQKIVNGGDLKDADTRAVDDLLDSI